MTCRNGPSQVTLPAIRRAFGVSLAGPNDPWERLVYDRLSPTVNGAAMTDIDDYDAGMVALNAVDDAPFPDSDPE